MKYALNLSENGRILSATYDAYAPVDAQRVEGLPEGDITDYRYADGAYIYDPLPVPVQPESEATAEDILNVLLGVM